MKPQHPPQPRRKLLSALIAASALITTILAIVINLATNLIPQSWQKLRHYPLLITSALVLLTLVAAFIAIAIQRKSEQADKIDRDSPSIKIPWMVPVQTRAFISRPEIVDRILSFLTKPAEPTSTRLIALIGAGGFGKTSIAQEIGRLPQVRRQFPGGLLWVTIGNASGPDLASRIGFLAEQLDSERLTDTDPQQAGMRLASILSHREPSLLIIDDVWTKDQLSPFLQGGPSCTRLITTRAADIIPSASVRISINEMSIQQSVQLLTSGSTQMPTDTALPLLHVTGRWPLLLALINGLVTDLVASGSTVSDAVSTYLSMLEKNGPTALDKLTSDTTREHLVTTTLEASLLRLTAEYRNRFLELGIFPQGIEIPRSAIVRLWNATARMNEDEADALCHRLFALSLVSSYKISFTRLHDIVRSYLRSHSQSDTIKNNNEFIDQARRLLETKKTDPPRGGVTPWWLLPDDEDYLWENVIFHLQEAGRTKELTETVQDLRWIRKRIQRGNTVDAEADLSYSNQAKARMLKSQLASYSHLLRPVNGSRDVTSGLVNYVSRPLALDLDTKALVGERETGYLHPRWSVPETSTSPVTRVFGPNPEFMSAVAVSPDGTWVCAGGQDGVIYVWNTSTGNLNHRLSADDSPINVVDVSPDGSWLASGSGNGTVRIWSPQSGELKGTLTGHRDHVTGLRIFSDNETLVTVSYDGSMRIWKASNCTLRRIWYLDGLIRRLVEKIGHLAGYDLPTAALNTLALAPDDSWVAVGTYNRGIRILDTQTCKIRFPVEGKHEVIEALAVSPDGTKLAAGWGTGYPPITGSPLTIYNLTSDFSSSDYFGHEGSIGCIQFSPDGQWIATAGQDAAVRIWDSDSGHNYATLWGTEHGVSDLAVHSSGEWLVTACWDGTVRILRVAEDIEDSPDRYPNFLALATAPDDTWVAASGNGVSHIRRVSTGKIAYSFGTRGDAIIADPRGRWLAAASRGTVLVVPLRRGLHPLNLSYRGTVRTLAAAADGSWVAAAGDGDHAIQVWDVGTGKMRSALQGHTDRIAQICLIPETNLIASSGMDGTVRIWDVDGRGDPVILRGHRSWVTALAVSPDSTWLASGSDDRTVRVWNLHDYTLRTILEGHSREVRELASSPDGTWVASGGFDNTVRIWDVVRGSVQQVLRGHTEWIQSIAASPNGQWIATSGWDNTLRVWDITNGRCDAAFRSEGLIRACSWLSDGHTLAAAGKSGLYLWTYLSSRANRV